MLNFLKSWVKISAIGALVIAVASAIVIGVISLTTMFPWTGYLLTFLTISFLVTVLERLFTL